MATSPDDAARIAALQAELADLYRRLALTRPMQRDHMPIELQIARVKQQLDELQQRS